MPQFTNIFIHYLYEILPALAIGFFISGLVHEMIPEDKVLKYLGAGGIAHLFGGHEHERAHAGAGPRQARAAGLFVAARDAEIGQAGPRRGATGRHERWRQS